MFGTLHERASAVLSWRYGDRSGTQSPRDLVRAKREKPVTHGPGIGRLQLAIDGPARRTIRSGRHERLGDAELCVLSQPDGDVEARGSGPQDIKRWGTGSASREVLFVEDAAQVIVLAAEPHDGAEPERLGAGEEITIRKFVELIAEAAGLTGEIRQDPTKPDGPPRCALDMGRAGELFGFEARTSFGGGLGRTVEAHSLTQRRAAETKTVAPASE
ncbi:MAG TPA: NAD-dependent epimerase/dehydratase family protein [Propionibacteriaceae bacterium]